MLQKNLNKWAYRLRLWEVEWGLSQSQSTFWLQKQKSSKHVLIFTNWVAEYDFFYTNVTKSSWEYYCRRLNETRYLWEWYRFTAIWRRIKWKKKSANILLYTDMFEDYPLVRHLSKQTNEFYSVGWYPGLSSNRRKLLQFRYSQLIGKTEISALPSIVILFSTFYSITQQFLKELGASNIYYILFVSLSDYRNMLSGSYMIFMTKNYVNYYYYYHLIYRVIHGNSEKQHTNLAVGVSRSAPLSQRKRVAKIVRWSRYTRIRIWKWQIKSYLYRYKETKLRGKRRFWQSYLLWCYLKSCKQLRPKKQCFREVRKILKRRRRAVQKKRGSKKRRFRGKSKTAKTKTVKFNARK